MTTDTIHNIAGYQNEKQQIAQLQNTLLHLKDYEDSVKAYNQFELFKQKMDMLIKSDYVQLLSKETIIALVDACDLEESADIFSSKDLLDEAIQKATLISGETTIYSYIDQYCEAKELSNQKEPFLSTNEEREC